MVNKIPYDSSWDEGNESSWDTKYELWEERDWESWLEDQLTFPFEIIRREDFDSDIFSSNKNKDFGIGHIMTALAIDYDDETYGIIVKVKENRKTGYIPLADLEVTQRENENFWPVREYVVWFANQ
ncbi:MAG: calcium-binding protein [Methylococcaceae bacterium]|nr:calcium-binding protein [Methylococcaceae bacterium]